MMARWTAERRFTPAMPEAERDDRYAGWQRAVAGVLAMAGS
jgi:glycerol kinase